MLPSLLNVQNYFPGAGHLWSLAVEEHFYLLLPLVLAICLRRAEQRRRPTAVLWLAALVLPLCLLLRCLAPGSAWSHETRHFPTHLRIDALAFGVLLAYLHHFSPRVLAAVARRPGILLGASLALLSPFLFLEIKDRFVWTVGFTLLYLGYGGLLVYSLATPPPRRTAKRTPGAAVIALLAAIGVGSYSIYLWHAVLGVLPIQFLLTHGRWPFRDPGVSWLVASVAYVALAILLGTLVGRLVERPALLLRERLFPPRVEPPLKNRVRDSGAVVE